MTVVWTRFRPFPLLQGEGRGWGYFFTNKSSNFNPVAL